MTPIGLAVIPAGDEHSAPPGHPENLGRLSLILPELEKPEYRSSTVPIAPREYDLSVLHSVHSKGYIDTLATYSDPEIGFLDPDTFITAGSFAASCRVTWAVLAAVDLAFGSGPLKSFVLGRPPGHHAERTSGMGFCLVNHVAVVARFAISAHKAERVAIVDFDIHHGNGTQHAFYEEPDVLYISTHQHPFYPGTGCTDQTGRGAGEGFTLNFPLPAGTNDEIMTGLYQGEIAERIQKFHPDLMLLSAGFDGHRSDPIGGFNMTGDGYRTITELLVTLSDELCGGRLVSLLEGGYDAGGNLDAITNHIRALAKQ